MTTATPKAERSVLRAVAAALLGVVHAAGFAPPFGAWWLQSLALTLFLVLVQPRGGARVGRTRIACAVAFGTGWFASGLAWLHTSMHDYGGMPWAMAAAAVLLFALYLSLQPLAAVAFARRWSAPPNDTGAPPSARARAGWAVSLAGAWTLSEMLRGWLFTGFPWLSIGYAHVDGPLAGFAPWIGVYGVGAVAALACALVATVVDAAAVARAARRAAARAGAGRTARVGEAGPTMPPAPEPSTLGALALLALAVALPFAGAALGRVALVRPHGAPVTVRLLQGNVPQELKFDRARALRAMDDYTRLVESGSAQFTILPETAWTVPWHATPPDVAGRLQAHVRRTGAPVAIGMPLWEPSPPPGATPNLTNSVALLDDGADAPPTIAARYDKRHLVPFGEFIPFGFGWFVAMMRIPLGDFARGAPGQAPFEVAGQRFAFNVCYEDLFGELLIPSVRPPFDASVLVNVTNIAWFGDSHALPQHLAISRMRAIETGRPMLRATNTGVTASIDHRGRVLAALPHHRQAALDAVVQGTAGLTPYVRFGNALPLAAGALLLAAGRVAAGRGLRRKR